MDRAITETERRRAIQMAYNAEHGIVPKTIVKAIPDSIEISDKAENARMNTRRMGKLEREAAIDRLTREMKEAAKLLEFEHAAFLRDQILHARMTLLVAQTAARRLRDDRFEIGRASCRERV